MLNVNVLFSFYYHFANTTGHIYAINIRVEMAKLNFFEMLQIEEEIVIALLGIIFK